MLPLMPFALGALLSTGCAPKPSEDQCREAVENIRALTGQSRTEGGHDPKTAIRSCRARSSVETVKCQIAAKSMDALAGCEGDEGKRYLEEIERQEAEKAAETAKEAEAAPAPTEAAPAPIEPVPAPPTATVPAAE